MEDKLLEFSLPGLCTSVFGDLTGFWQRKPYKVTILCVCRQITSTENVWLRKVREK